MLTRKQWEMKLREWKISEALVSEWAIIAKKVELSDEGIDDFFSFYEELRKTKNKMADPIIKAQEHKICHYCKKDFGYLMKQDKDKKIIWSICFRCFRSFFDKMLGEGKDGGRIE